MCKRTVVNLYLYERFSIWKTYNIFRTVVYILYSEYTEVYVLFPYKNHLHKIFIISVQNNSPNLLMDPNIKYYTYLNSPRLYLTTMSKPAKVEIVLKWPEHSEIKIYIYIVR